MRLFTFPSPQGPHLRVKAPCGGKTNTNKGEKTMCKEELQTKLEKIALNKTIPFCYQCYKDAPSGICEFCHSDDLMRHLPGSGVEYGTDRVIREILQESLEAIDCEKVFEETMDDCYGTEVQIGWMTLNPVEVMKTQDPIAWDLAESEHTDSLEQDEQIISFDNGSTYYWTHDIEQFVEDNLIEAGVA